MFDALKKLIGADEEGKKRRQQALEEEEREPEERAKTLRLSRMPDGLNGSILCLEMEGQNVRVHTEEGSGLVLQSFSDAVRELSEDDGMMVHRFWWVARKAVESFESKNRKRTFILSNGLRVPVSTNHFVDVHKAGWLN